MKTNVMTMAVLAAGAAVGLVLFASTASADTLTVGSGGTYSTIQAAIDAANSGDTIQVASGTYAEHLMIQKSNISLIGADKLTTIIDATQNPSWTVAKAGISIVENVATHQGHGVTVSGFTIRNAYLQTGGAPFAGEKYGPGPGGMAGVQIYGSSNNSIEDNIFLDNYWHTWLVAEASAAGYTQCRNNRIAGNNFGSSANDAVYLYSDGGVYIEDTQILNNLMHDLIGTSASGVDVWGYPEGGPTPTVKGTLIQGNDISHCSQGIRLRSDVADIAGTVIHQNNIEDILGSGWGVRNDVASTIIDARYNWWGDASGPYDGKTLPGSPNYNNPSGLGEPVTSYVDYADFLTAPVPEPATLGLLVLGGLALIRRRRTA